MKLGIKCKVESETFIGSSELNTVVDGNEYSLVSDSKGLLNEIIIKIKSPDIDKQIAKISLSVPPSPTAGKVNIQLSEKDIDEARALLQYIESALSFSVNLKKIYWEEPSYMFIPETDEERLYVNISEFTLNKNYPAAPQTLTIDTFNEIVLNRSKYQFLMIAMAFHREGLQEYLSFRYINAFYNFYYVIEDLYGAGKTKNAAVENELKRDTNFREFVSWAIDYYIQFHHVESIKRFLAEENKTYDVDGLIELIVQVRGNLHHFSSKSSKRKGTPFNHEDFESMAFLLLGLSVRCIQQKMLEKDKEVAAKTHSQILGS